MSRFEIFLESPYFNRSEKLLKFYRLLSAHYPKFESGSLAKERLYGKLYGASKYKDKTMRDLTSLLYQLANDFIGYEQIKNDDLGLHRQRYSWLAKKGPLKLREQGIEYSEKLFMQHQVQDSQFYLHRWLADFDKFEYQADIFKDVEHKLIRSSDLEEHLHSLDRYYLIKYFETQLYLLSVSAIFNQPFNEAQFQHADILAQKYIEQGDVVIDLYYYLVQFEKTVDERYYDTLKTKFLANDPKVPEVLKIEIAVSLENFLAKKIRVGEEPFLKDLMGIFRFIIEHGLMYYKGEIRYYFYQNVTMAGIKAGELDWVEQFIEDFKSKISEQYREDVYLYCKAHLLFERKKFDEALQLALSVNPIMYFNKIDIKGLIVRIHYELGMFEQLEIILDSYKYYIADGKLSQEGKERYSNFVKDMRKLVRLRQNYDTKTFSLLSDHFNRTSKFPSQTWFQEKIKELVKPGISVLKQMEDI